LRAFLYCKIFILSSLLLVSQPKIILSNDIDSINLTNNQTVYHINEGSLPLDSLLVSPQNYPFLRNKNNLIVYKHPGKWYWIRTEILSDTLQNANWVLECYNPTIDSLEIYWVYEKGHYKMQRGGTYQNFSSKEIKHKNHVFPMPKDFRKGILFIKLKNKEHANIEIKLKKIDFFVNYALSEYFILGVYYGSLLLVVLFNFVLYLGFKNWVYITYILYVFSIGIYSSTLDGFGFQYLWPSYPSWNENAYQIMHFVVLTFFSLYFTVFLQIYIRYKNLFYFLVLWYIIRSIVLAFPTLNEIVVNELLFFDNVPYLLAFFTSIVAYIEGYKPARFSILAYTALLSGFAIHSLRFANMIPATIFTTYALYIGTILEIFFLSLALSDYMTKITKFNLKILKETKDLRNKIEQQSKILNLQGEFLKEKTKDFNTLLYRISHDIQGPVKTIKGLVNLMFSDSFNTKEYVSKIGNNVTLLEKIIKDLVVISNLNENKKIEIQEIDLLKLLDNVVKIYEDALLEQKISLSIKTETDKEFASDTNYLEHIFSNLLDNAIKFQKKNYNHRKIEIHLSVDYEKMIFEITDNGIGMSKEESDKIFELFYKKQNSSGTGLGLFIVKLCVDKLKGKITVNSKPDEGSKFTVTIPNQIFKVK